MENLISVIVPIYKVEKYLDRCVESITNQSYRNIEIILVDDGSPDNCPTMCDDWKSKDARIKVIHKQNGGLSDARNKGMEAATGQYICFVDSDDFIHEDYIKTLYQNLLDTNSDLSICSFCKVSDKKRYSPSINNSVTTYEGNEIFKCLFKTDNLDFIVAWSKLYSKKSLDGLQFDLGKLNEDEFIAHKVFSKCDKIVHTKSELYLYYTRDESITKSSNFTINNLDSLYAIEERYNFFKNTEFREQALRQLINLMPYLYSTAKMRNANKEILKIIQQKFLFYYQFLKHKSIKQRLFRLFPNCYATTFKILRFIKKFLYRI